MGGKWGFQELQWELEAVRRRLEEERKRSREQEQAAEKRYKELQEKLVASEGKRGCWYQVEDAQKRFDRTVLAQSTCVSA
eukprot:3824844-Rhodomonas_salina.5